MNRRTKVSTLEAQARQAKQDREYLAACEAHGIEPAPASYRGSGYCFAGTSVDDAVLSHRQSSLVGGAITECDSDDDIDARLGWAEPDAELDCALEIHAEAERALTGILNLLIPEAGKICPRAIGTKILALAWLLEHGRVGAESQTESARRTGQTRANVSESVRTLQKTLGGRLRSRGQKSAQSVEVYRKIRNEAVKAGHGNLRNRKVID